MKLSRKRRRELKKLRRSAEHLVAEQREAIHHASEILRDAQKSARGYAREELAPRMEKAYRKQIRPAVESGIYTARKGISEDIIPSAAGAIGSALAMLEVAKDPRVREVVKRAGKATTTYSKQASKLVAPKKKSGPGRFILLALGLVAAGGIAYAAWQTLRADDDLWIEDIEESTSEA